MSVSISVSLKKRQGTKTLFLKMLTVQTNFVKHCMQLIWTVRSLCVPVWKSFPIKNPQNNCCFFLSHLCHYTDKYVRIPFARKQQEHRSHTIIYKHIFERPSQRALGKYSSLQLTRKTIAQTTALRQKGHELLSWVFHELFVAFLPTTVHSTFDYWLKRFIRLLILLFFFFFSFFFPTRQPFLPLRENHNYDCITVSLGCAEVMQHVCVCVL